MKKVMSFLIGVVLVFIIAGGVYLNKQDLETRRAVRQKATQADAAISTTNSTVATSSEKINNEVVKTFTVTGKNFSFSPSTITVKKGDTVVITFKNMGGLHDFRLDEFGVATQQISNGSEETVTFVANKPGMFEYYCSVGKHRAMGMKGVLIVE